MKGASCIMKITAHFGDTLRMYSEWFSIPYQLIADCNKHLSLEKLSQGDCVIIPGYEKHGMRVEQNEKSNHFPLELLRRLSVESEKKISEGKVLLPKRVEKRIVNGKKPYDFQALCSDLDQLCEHFPFIRKRIIGQSVLGLPLIEIEIGSGKKRIHMNGSFHANEWITSAVIMTFVNDYLLALTNQLPLKGHDMLTFYEDVTLSIVPMVNPDGVNLVLNGPPDMEPYRSKVISLNNGSMDFSDWKANIRGIDLNNQFPAKWEVEKERKIPKQPAPRDFPGFSPLTEPESIAMAKLTEEGDFSKIVAFHTQGKEIYWGYEGYEPAESEKTVGEFSKVSGYKAVKFIDSHAGYRDWFIQKWRRQGYTVELGEGVNPLPIEQFDEIYHDCLGIFLAALYMD